MSDSAVYNTEIAAPIFSAPARSPVFHTPIARDGSKLITLTMFKTVLMSSASEILSASKSLASGLPLKILLHLARSLASADSLRFMAA